MTLQPDAGALLKLANDCQVAFYSDDITLKNIALRKSHDALLNARQAASQGSAGGERSEVRTGDAKRITGAVLSAFKAGGDNLAIYQAVLGALPAAQAAPESIEQLCDGITDENRHPEIAVSALVPEGFALVPIEPTKEMIQASIWALDRWREKHGNVQGFVPPGEKYQIRWRAMLDAAASPVPSAERGHG